MTSVGTNTSNITSLSKSINDINALANTIKNNQYNIEQLGRYINVLRNEKYLWTRKISLDISTSIQSGGSIGKSGWLSEYYDIYTEQALSAKVIEVFSNATEASGYKVTDDLEIETDWGTYTVAYSDSLRLINRNSSTVYVDHVLIEVLFVRNEDRSVAENDILDTEFEYDEYYS